jgi:hypothetical protein
MFHRLNEGGRRLAVDLFNEGLKLTAIGGAQHGKRQVLKYPTAVEIEDAKLASGVDGLLDNLELATIRCPQMRDGDLAGDELADPEPTQLIEDRAALNRLSCDDQHRFFR